MAKFLDTSSSLVASTSITLQKRIFINNQIRASVVRVIDETGRQIGTMPTGEALRIAQTRGLDLIQVTDKVEPPVCKLMEYGKYLYQEEKKQRMAKPQRGDLKIIRLTFNISPHDMTIKAQQTEKLLNKGNKVMVDIRLRGRENTLQSFANRQVNKFLEILRGFVPYKIERGLKKEARGMTIIISKS